MLHRGFTFTDESHFKTFIDKKKKNMEANLKIFSRIRTNISKCYNACMALNVFFLLTC